MKNIHLDTILFNNSMESYLIAGLIFLISFLLCKLVAYIIKKMSKKMSDKIKHHTVKVLLSTDKRLSLILQYIPVYIASQYLVLPKLISIIVGKLGIIVFTVTTLRYMSDIIGALIRDYYEKEGSNKLFANSAKLVAKLTIWSFGILFMLSNLGINVTTLVAGLGVTGMALAFASKEILSDLFNYFIITFDRPFNIGDSISVNGRTGTVQSIGLRGTRLISVTGEQLVISNTDITKGVLNNYSVMSKRRVQIRLGIRSDNDIEKINSIPEIVKEIILSCNDVELVSTVFSEFTDSCINFLVTFNLYNCDYSFYLSKQHEIAMKILNEFNSKGIVMR